ncbi:MAG: crotonase/enoyl-CoA hydratase family protein [Aeromicrobium sp.]
MTEELVVERVGSVQVITINRPEAKNALNAAVAHGIANAVDDLDADDSLRAGILTGAGGTFCSGIDLKAFIRGETPLVGNRGIAGITKRPPRKPMIAAVEGWALAGGFELLLACDLVVAARSSQFGVPEVKRGLAAGGGGAYLLPKRLPLAIAMEMLLTGDPIEAARAEALGMVNRVVEDGAALGGALELAMAISRNGPLAVAVSKKVARESSNWSWDEGWTIQEDMMRPVFASNDAHEGATAFAEKRDPLWTGT